MVIVVLLLKVTGIKKNSEQDIFFDEILEYLVFQLQFYPTLFTDMTKCFFPHEIAFYINKATDFDQHSCVAKNELLSLVLFCAQLHSHGDKVAAEKSCNSK